MKSVTVLSFVWCFLPVLVAAESPATSTKDLFVHRYDQHFPAADGAQWSKTFDRNLSAVVWYQRFALAPNTKLDVLGSDRSAWHHSQSDLAAQNYTVSYDAANLGGSMTIIYPREHHHDDWTLVVFFVYNTTRFRANAGFITYRSGDKPTVSLTDYWRGSVGVQDYPGTRITTKQMDIDSCCTRLSVTKGSTEVADLSAASNVTLPFDDLYVQGVTINSSYPMTVIVEYQGVNLDPSLFPVTSIVQGVVSLTPYGPNEVRAWPVDIGSNVISLIFTSFSLEEGHALLQILNLDTGQSIANITGMLPSNHLVTYNYSRLVLVFSSDEFTPKGGFEAHYLSGLALPTVCSTIRTCSRNSWAVVGIFIVLLLIFVFIIALGVYSHYSRRTVRWCGGSQASDESRLDAYYSPSPDSIDIDSPRS